MTPVRMFQGPGPSRSLLGELTDHESCFARFAGDPDSRVWVCARVGEQIFSSALPRDDEWVMPV